VSRTAHELEKIGPHIVGLKIRNDVAILWSRDSDNAISYMPFTSSGPQWSFAGPTADYGSLVQQIHRSLYDLNVGTDFVFPETQDFSQYKLLIVPALYIADDALLQRISDYVRNGGHVVMTFKSGFANENSAVRWVRAPGPLREAAGFSYQEFSNLEKPIALKGDPYQAGSGNEVRYWAEFLMPEHAKALAYYDHPFFGKWPAITENEFGKGTLLYEGTYLSDTLQTAVLKAALAKAGLTGPDQNVPTQVHVQHGVNRIGKKLHYYFNYSAAAQTTQYPYGGSAERRYCGAGAHANPRTVGPCNCGRAIKRSIGRDTIGHKRVRGHPTLRQPSGTKGDARVEIRQDANRLSHWRRALTMNAQYRCHNSVDS